MDIVIAKVSVPTSDGRTIVSPWWNDRVPLVRLVDGAYDTQVFGVVDNIRLVGDDVHASLKTHTEAEYPGHMRGELGMVVWGRDGSVPAWPDLVLHEDGRRLEGDA